MSKELRFQDFAFDLPQELFVNEYYRRVEDIRLIVVNANDKTITEDCFINVDKYFDQNDTLVFNDMGIAPSRLNVKLSNGQEIIICFLMKSLKKSNQWECVILYEEDYPVGEAFSIRDRITGTILQKTLDFDGGYWVEKDRYKGFRGLVEISCDTTTLMNELNQNGDLIYPWYANLDQLPKKILNPITSEKTGGILVSEPARRFTPEILNKLSAKQVDIMKPSLKMSFSWRLFQPEQKLSEYKMNAEEFEVEQKDINILQKSIKENKRIISIGTSGVRMLESLNYPLKPTSGRTDILIKPGHKFKFVDGLLTNLHNSMGTHVIMGAAIGGIDLVLEACRLAVKNGYGFGIHGDSMLILGNYKKSNE
ncbi:MAG: S-adenosylmethionine:tRNA ribosyltransferase-isomerase [Dysgonamonadaceae bacterium]|nr:S-adenosylmethionine:tRNA ribosyltransferase-isomerase [Dysgonamonadaceae bacterium]